MKFMVLRCILVLIPIFCVGGEVVAATGSAGSIEPLAAVGKNSAGSAGLFVGVSKFPESSGLRELTYAVDDAIAVAHLFVAELKLIPPDHARLALGGEPTSATAKANLEDLKQLKVAITPDTKRDTILDAADEATKLANDPDGLLLFCFSTHGYEDRGDAYIMPGNGKRDRIATTGIALTDVKAFLSSANASKKLLIVDACRESAGTMTKGETVMKAKFREAFKNAEGLGILASCSTGQLSWEEPAFEQGVFTHYLLEAFKGNVPGDAKNGFIHLGDVSRYVAEQTRNWVMAKRKENQDPWFEGEAARDIPLAVHKSSREMADRLAERRKAAERTLDDAHQRFGQFITIDLRAEVEKAFETLDNAPLEKLLTKIEHLLKSGNESDVEDFAAWWKVNAPKNEPTLATSRTKLERTTAVDAQPARSATASNPKSKRPLLLTYLDSHAHGAHTSEWRSVEDNFANLLTKGIREQGSFDVQYIPQYSRNVKLKPDYLLEIQVDTLKHAFEQPRRQTSGIGNALGSLFKVNGKPAATPQATDFYQPYTELLLHWKLMTPQSVIKGNDSATMKLDGEPIPMPVQNGRSRPPQARETTFPDDPVVSNVAKQIVEQLGRVKLDDN